MGCYPYANREAFSLWERKSLEKGDMGASGSLMKKLVLLPTLIILAGFCLFCGGKRVEVDPQILLDGPPRSFSEALASCSAQAFERYPRLFDYLACENDGESAFPDFSPAAISPDSYTGRTTIIDYMHPACREVSSRLMAGLEGVELVGGKIVKRTRMTDDAVVTFRNTRSATVLRFEIGSSPTSGWRGGRYPLFSYSVHSRTNAVRTRILAAYDALGTPYLEIYGLSPRRFGQPPEDEGERDQ